MQGAKEEVKETFREELFRELFRLLMILVVLKVFLVVTGSTPNDPVTVKHIGFVLATVLIFCSERRK